MNDPVRLACPHCMTLNRLPADRLGDGPNCGRCTWPLFARRPVDLDEAGFRAHGERSELPLLVDFWAPWCGPCKVMGPQFEQAAARLEPALRLGKVDTQAHPGLGSRFGIRSLPTLVLFSRGRELDRQSGALSAADIERWARARLQ